MRPPRKSTVTLRCTLPSATLITCALMSAVASCGRLPRCASAISSPETIRIQTRRRCMGFHGPQSSSTRVPMFLQWRPVKSEMPTEPSLTPARFPPGPFPELRHNSRKTRVKYGSFDGLVWSVRWVGSRFSPAVPDPTAQSALKPTKEKRCTRQLSTWRRDWQLRRRAPGRCFRA